MLGILAALLAQAMLTIVLYGALNESPVFAYAVYLLPGVIGIGLLLRPQTRQTGAGILLGLAVGAIVAAGVCTVITAVAMSNAS